MATRYNSSHKVDIFSVGDLVSLAIPRQNRKSTDNTRIFCRVVHKPHPDRHQLQCSYGILDWHYPTKELERVPKTLEIIIPDHQQKISLHKAAQLSSTSLVVAAESAEKVFYIQAGTVYWDLYYSC